MDQTVSGRPIARMTIPPMIAKVDPSRKYVTAAPTTPAKPMAVNTFHAGVMDWPCGCVAMQAPFHKTCSKTSRLLRPSIVHQGDSQTRQAVTYSEYSDCDTRTQNRCCLPIVVNDAECPDQAQNPTFELSTPNMLCHSCREPLRRKEVVLSISRFDYFLLRSAIFPTGMISSYDGDSDRVGCTSGCHRDSRIRDGTVAAVRDHQL